MGLSYGEAKKLTFGKFCELFDEYKKIHNIIATQSTFSQPQKVESVFDGYIGDGDEIEE